MTYVVAEPCVNCRYTDCAIPCPVEAFHLDDDMLVINPETCIDCDACVPECGWGRFRGRQGAGRMVAIYAD